MHSTKIERVRREEKRIRPVASPPRIGSRIGTSNSVIMQPHFPASHITSAAIDLKKPISAVGNMPMSSVSAATTISGTSISAPGSAF